MSSRLLKICLQSKAFILQLRPGRDWLVFAFFVLVSGFFWLLATLNEYYESDVMIPVVITDVPNTVGVDGGTEDTIHAVIREKGFVIMVYKYIQGVAPVEVEFDVFSRQRGKISVSNIELKKLLSNVLESTVSIISLKPEKLEYTYSQKIEKEVPVILTGEIETEGNYYISQSLTIPDRVKVYVTKAMADSVKFVETEPLDINHVTDSTSVSVALRPIRGVSFEQKKVTVKIYADILTESSEVIPITAVNVPEGVTLRFFPSSVRVKYVFAASMYEQVDKREFVVEANFENIEPDSEKCPISIVSMPPGVVKADPDVTEVEYLMEN